MSGSFISSIIETDAQMNNIPGYVPGSVIENAFAEINKRTVEMGRVIVEIEFLGIVDGYRFVLNGNEYVVKGQQGFDISGQLSLIERNYGQFKDEDATQFAINELEKRINLES